MVEGELVETLKQNNPSAYRNYKRLNRRAKRNYVFISNNYDECKLELRKKVFRTRVDYVLDFFKKKPKDYLDDDKRYYTCWSLLNNSAYLRLLNSGKKGKAKKILAKSILSLDYGVKRGNLRKGALEKKVG